MPINKRKHYIYLVKCSDSSYYCGYTTDIKKRLYDHNNTKKGAKYTRNRRPVELVYYEEHTTKSAAMKREYLIKHLSHNSKKKICNEFKLQ